MSDPARSFEVRHVAEPEASRTAMILRRGLTLTADAIVLTLASPFFAVWYLQRAIRNRLRSKT